MCFSLQRVICFVFILHKVNINSHFVGIIKKPVDFREVTKEEQFEWVLESFQIPHQVFHTCPSGGPPERKRICYLGE